MASPSHGQNSHAPGATIAIKAKRMLDVVSGKYVDNAVVIIDGGRITSAGSNTSVPAEARLIDLGDTTLLPGLIDCHTHLLQNYDFGIGGDDLNMLKTVAQMSTAKRALLGAKMGREDLEAGITTVRDLGNSGVNGDVALRDAIDAGWVIGPRIVASTRAISATGGQFGQLTLEAQKIVDQEYAVVSGPEEARKTVRQALYDGADCIKIIVDTHPRVLAPDELKAIVAEAHRMHKRVAAHAIVDESIREAAEAGVDSIEHGYDASDASLKVMAAKRTFLVPTDYPAEFYYSFGAAAGETPEQRKQRESGLKQFADSNHDRLRRAIKAGVRIAAGSDEYYQEHGLTRGQASLLMLQAYAESGMSPIEIIRAATINAAELLDRSRDTGSIEKGKFADIIAVAGDPLKDIGALKHVGFVMKGGAVIKNEVTH